MTEIEAKKRLEKEFARISQREARAIERAKADGIWVDGLDTNKELLKPFHDERVRVINQIQKEAMANV